MTYSVKQLDTTMIAIAVGALTANATFSYCPRALSQALGSLQSTPSAYTIINLNIHQ